MRKYALLNNNIVEIVLSLTEDSILEKSKDYQLIIDVEDLVITPIPGYVLNGNQLVPGQGQIVSIKDMIMSKIASYQSISPLLLRDLYATNTLMGITTVQSNEMFSEYSDVILRLSQGAFPTAIYSLQNKQPSGFVTQEIINGWIAKIQANL